MPLRAEPRATAAIRSDGRLARESLLVFLAYGAVAVWWLWPLPLYASDHLAYVGTESRLLDADTHLIVWSLAWDTHALLTEPWNLFQANAFYPAPFPLAYSEHFLGDVPSFAPFYLATGNPILATNAMILLLHPLCGLGLYLLARRFTSAPAAFLGGLAFAFYPGRLESLGHFHMLGVAYLPLAIFFTERWLEGARRRDAAGAAAALLLQLLSSFYLAYGTALAYGLYLALALIRSRAGLDRRRVRGLAWILAAGVGPFLLTSIPYVVLRRWGLIPSYGAEGGLPAFGLVPYVAVQAVRDHFLGGGVGWIGMALAAGALAPPWPRGRWGRILSLSLVVLGTLLALGPRIPIGGFSLPSPYLLLQGIVPGFGAIRMPRRFLFVAQLGLALLVALGWDRITRGRGVRLAWVGALVCVAVSLWLFRPLPRPDLHARTVGEDVPEVYRWLRRGGGGRPLLELPPKGFREAARRMYLSTYHWLPIIEGYSGYPPDSVTYVIRQALRLPAEESLERLVRTVDVGWIVVHRDELPDGGAAWDGGLPDGLEIAGRFGRDLLVRVTRRGVSDARAHLFGSERTLGEVPIAPLGDHCPGQIRLTAPIRGVQPAGSVLPVHVAIRNDGDRPWPGLGFLPRHLVREMACFGVGDEPCRAASQPLYADVLPGEPVEAMLLVHVPRLAGDYRLFVRLVQVGDGYLDECGVAPLRVPVRSAPRLADGPRGSYWESCGACRWGAGTLACLCRDAAGVLREATTVAACPTGYANRDGRLVCEGSG